MSWFQTFAFKCNLYRYKEVLSAASASCGTAQYLFYTSPGGQTFFAPTDEACELLFFCYFFSLPSLFAPPLSPSTRTTSS
jgi:hypothetical protein